VQNLMVAHDIDVNFIGKI